MNNNSRYLLMKMSNSSEIRNIHEYTSQEDEIKN